MEPLTDKQQAFFDFLVDYWQTHHHWPSYPRIRKKFGYKSDHSVTQNYDALIQKGYLAKDTDGNYQFTSEEYYRTSPENGLAIPIVGEITAGSMREAIETDLGELTFGNLFSNVNEVFALRVSGMSMKNLEISDGDYVLLSKSELRNGDVGAVLYEGETTLKRVYREENRIRLEAANEEFEDIIIRPGEEEEVTILGKYVGHLNEHGLFKSPF